MSMTAQRWQGTCDYLHEVFGPCPEAPTALSRTLASWPDRARAADLPNIAVSAEVGRLLSLLAAIAGAAPGSTRRMIEIGTLGGYSALWLLRGMGAGGVGGVGGVGGQSASTVSARLFTLECEPRHAAFARAEFARAQVSDHVELIEARALDALPDLARRLGPASIDLVFIDADKRELPDYWRAIEPLLHPGGILIVDNALGSNHWWINDGDDDLPDPVARASRAAVDRFNRQIAADPRFETACVPIRQGVLIARRSAP